MLKTSREKTVDFSADNALQKYLTSPNKDLFMSLDTENFLFC
jgi:hypothetical protein